MKKSLIASRKYDLLQIYKIDNKKENKTSLHGDRNQILIPKCLQKRNQKIITKVLCRIELLWHRVISNRVVTASFSHFFEIFLLAY